MDTNAKMPAAGGAGERVGEGGKKRKAPAPYEGPYRYEETAKKLGPWLTEFCEGKMDKDEFWPLACMEMAEHFFTRTEASQSPAAKNMKKLVTCLQGVDNLLVNNPNADLKKYAEPLRNAFVVEKAADPLEELLKLGDPAGKDKGHDSDEE